MAVILVLILGLILWGFIGNREEQEKEKRIAREKREDMEAKVQEAEALIPKVATSAFYKGAASSIRAIISVKENKTRWGVVRAYNEYRATHTGMVAYMGLDDIGWNGENGGVMNISPYEICDCYADGESGGLESDGTAFGFQHHGYANLTRSQLYALIKVILRDFKCLSSGNITEIELQRNVFEVANAGVRLELSPQYSRTIAEAELRKLQSEQTPYKNAF